jgi:hypothetical protein
VVEARLGDDLRTHRPAEHVRRRNSPGSHRHPSPGAADAAGVDTGYLHAEMVEGRPGEGTGCSHAAEVVVERHTSHSLGEVLESHMSHAAGVVAENRMNHNPEAAVDENHRNRNPEAVVVGSYTRSLEEEVETEEGGVRLDNHRRNPLGHNHRSLT